jgi:glutathione S-transferase
MKLRYSPTSPYVRKVTVTAHETGLNGRIQRVPTVTTDPASGLAQDNPLGKVPVLILDDGQRIFDSPVICEYLDSLHQGPKIVPPSGPERWVALRRQALADGILDAAVLRLLEGRRPANEQSPTWIAKQKAVIERSLDALEGEVDRLGDSLTIGHIAIGVALGYLDFRFAGDRWRDRHPKLARWNERFQQRPSMSSTVPRDPS